MDIQSGDDELATVATRLGPRFTRSQPRQRAVGYRHARLGDALRKKGCPHAEYWGQATPDGIQHLLAHADGDAEALRDDFIAYVADNRGHADGVLVIDETGFATKITLASRMVERVLNAGVEAVWLTADAGYGMDNYGCRTNVFMRRMLECLPVHDGIRRVALS
jgi:SRSO17 transposase